ncbi:protein phosphatase type 1 complex subunit Hex2/Reg1 [Xylariaceae sp. FL0255]|nr:protein phosphatase type 1 complex subunit Hex2/Reg1 [Xylariaceae sp. FL0255]
MAAAVLSSEESDLFSASGLRRSHSQSKFLSKSSSTFRTSASTSKISDLFSDEYRSSPIQIVTGSTSSSAPSSPTTLHPESIDPSYNSTPTTNLSLDGQCKHDDLGDHSLLLSEYSDNPYFMSLNELDELQSPLSPPASPTDEDQSPALTSRPDSPVATEHAEDDTAVKQHPTQHVDYLSHDWKEEDIWSSWRYIISKRREFANAPRLENASWRTWMKAKLKDCDVTWLYGPLQTGQCNLLSDSPERSSAALSRCDSFVHKKPILKKRSMSEVMLQRSLSSSSLLKQATAVVQAQQQDGTSRITRPAILQRSRTDFITFPFSERRSSRANTSLDPSTTTSGLTTPATEKKHIHFDEQVQQCIAVEVKGEDEDEDELDPYHWRYDDSDDDDAIMMKNTKTKKRPLFLRKRTPVNSNAESKTIAMLPSTTLKYREDSPAPQENAIKHSTGIFASPTLSPSLSQETLRPSKPSGNFFAGEDDDDENGPATGNIPSSPSNMDDQPAGMRRTESGMFMPYEEGEVQANDGIIGRVIDTVNTARDIAHVIWNVGWRR